MRFSKVLVALPLSTVLIGGCAETSGDADQGPRPQIVAVSGPKSAVVVCDPATTGGSCPLPIEVTFRLAEDQFVWKAYVRFQGDGGDDGVDRGYLLERTSGRGDVDTAVTVNASIPPTILRTEGALFRYTVRLVTGAGEESAETPLSISVQ